MNRKLTLRTGVILAALVIVAAFSITAFGPAETNRAAYLGCNPNGFIFKYQGSPDTAIQGIDMVTGQDFSAGAVNAVHFNAVGYNPSDNYFYGWDLNTSQFARVNASGLTSNTPIQHYTNAQIGFPGGHPITSFFSGDVSTDSRHWTFSVSGGTTTWYRINVSGSTPAYEQLGTTPNPNIVGKVLTSGTDWAYVPGTGYNKLYRAMDNTTDNTIEIFAFDPANTAAGFAHVGTVTSISPATDGDMGSVYADPKGNFYVSSHNSGSLFRIDLDTLTSVELEATDPDSNDGARCSLASVPVDFSDAPAGYGTLIANDGPRHNIPNFNIFESTAPLMLGKKIDIENDGFPTADATGDDADHEGIQGGQPVDDERGVTHIVANEGSSDPLVVPAYVTNTTSDAATLVGWIDLDNDGAFETTERVSVNVPAGFFGYQQLTFPAPPAPYSAGTIARFRLFSASDTSTTATSLLPTGPAASGEVEDVQVQLGTYEVTKSANPAEGSIIDPGASVTYTLTIRNTGSTNLTNLKIDDDLTDVLDDATVEGAPTVNPGSAGTASITGNTLEFVGDVEVGGVVTVSYAVKVKDGGTLGNAALNNYVLANHSTSCHPDVNGGSGTVDDPDCKTSHNINGLANTGVNMFALVLLSGGILAVAGAVLYFGLRRKDRASTSLLR